MAGGIEKVTFDASREAVEIEGSAHGSVIAVQQLEKPEKM